MDERRQQRINEAAEEFADAVTESYRAAAERGVSAQELNAELAQQFFSNVVETLRRQTEETRGASQELAEQTERRQLKHSPRSPLASTSRPIFWIGPKGRGTAQVRLQAETGSTLCRKEKL